LTYKKEKCPRNPYVVEIENDIFIQIAVTKNKQKNYHSVGYDTSVETTRLLIQISGDF